MAILKPGAKAKNASGVMDVGAHILAKQVSSKAGGQDRKDIRTFFDLIEFDEGRMK